MSQLYQDPRELQKQLGNNKTGNWFQDTFTDWVTPGLSIGDDGRVKREGAAWWLQGLAPGAEGIAKKKKELAEAQAVSRVIQKSRLTDEDIRPYTNGQPITTSNVERIVATAAREYQPQYVKDEIQQRNKVSDAQISNLEGQLELAQQTAADNAANQKLALQLDERKDIRNQENLAQQRLLSAQTNQMQMGFEYARLAQQERNRREDREEKAFLRILSGLNNLGQAFLV